MLIRDEVDTSASEQRAWELIADPSLHSLWNPHIIETESGGSACLGSHYWITYELSGRRTKYEAEIVEFSPPTRFAAKLVEPATGDGGHGDRFMLESYTVTRHHRGLRVRHEVRITHSGIPLPLRILIWLIMKFGAPQGKPFMERFRELAEQRGAADDALTPSSGSWAATEAGARPKPLPGT